MNSGLITEEKILEYQRNGAVCIRGLFSREWLDLLAKGVEKNFQDPGPYHTWYTPEDQPGGFYDDYCNWARIEEYRDFIFESPAGRLAAELMQSRVARIYHEHVLVKEPGTTEVTPWHHDLPYYGVNGTQLCSIWLPLDPVPIQACPKFVSASHLTEKLYYPRLFVSHKDYSEGKEGFESIPNIDEDEDEFNLLSWELELGDCIVFNMKTIHGAPATIGMTNRRRGYSTRWLGDDACFAERPWKTSPPFENVKLSPGAPMEHEAFPVIWSG